mmetsp:Transcript_21570/g.31927  ORF Transcript_21570/g.31927 Transcript_21570/m.31927 type:complete len:218 (+) Transcript_21570:1618-2271(+)
MSVSSVNMKDIPMTKLSPIRIPIQPLLLLFAVLCILLAGRACHSFLKQGKRSTKEKQRCAYNSRTHLLQNSCLMRNVHEMNLLCVCSLTKRSTSKQMSNLLASVELQSNQSLKSITTLVSLAILGSQIVIQMHIPGSFLMYFGVEVLHSFARMSSVDPGKSSHLSCIRLRKRTPNRLNIKEVHVVHPRPISSLKRRAATCAIRTMYSTKAMSRGSLM